MFDFKKNPKWVPFGFLIIAMISAFLIGKSYIGLAILISMTAIIQKSIFFPVNEWVVSYSGFKVYTICGMWIFSAVAFIADYYSKADNYNEILFIIIVLWTLYLEYKVFKQKL